MPPTEQIRETGQDLGAFVKAEAKRQGLSFAEVARRGGDNPSSVAAIANGEINKPNDECVRKLAKGLGVSVDRLMRLRDRGLQEAVDEDEHGSEHEDDELDGPSDVPKLENEILNLREKDFPKGRCGLCRYFVEPNVCKILEGPVAAELVCDGFQGIEEGFPPYEVRDEDWLDFVNGMVKEQPYQHVVVAGHLTPAGPIVIIKDTIKPKPHIFSLSKKFHIGHTCVDMETRAVTKDGPKTFDTLQEGEEVFCLNPKSGHLELRPVKEIRVYPYKGRMFHWTGNKYNFLVTPNHRVFCLLDNQTESRNLKQVETVQSLVASGQSYAMVQKKTGVSVPTISRWVNLGAPRRVTKAMNRKVGRFDVLEACELAGRYKFRLPVPTSYKSRPIKAVVIPNRPRGRTLPNHLAPDLFLRLAGWYVSEGCSSEKHGMFSISAFSTLAKKEIQSLFSEFGQTPPWRNGSFVLYSIAMAKLFGPLFGRVAHEKRVPEFVKNAPPDQLKLFLETYLKGDGSVQDSGAWRATTVSARLKDDLVEIAWKLGLVPSVRCTPAGERFVIRKRYNCRAAYDISACRARNSVVNVSGREKRCQELDYTGIVWCPVVEDHENFLMERNGKYLFTGNSREHHWTQEDVDGFIEAGRDIAESILEGIRPAFGSPGGKKLLAQTIVKLIPEHTKYVEPFSGAAAVFFSKDPSTTEILNDSDSEIAEAFKFIQANTGADRTKLLSHPMERDPKAWDRLKASAPSDLLEKFHRFLYLNAFSMGNARQHYADGVAKTIAHKVGRMDRLAERLKDVEITSKDFREVIAEHDGPGTFFYLDPPYPTQQGKLKTDLKTADIVEAVKKIRGKFILSLPDDKETREAFRGFEVQKVSVRRTFEMKNPHFDGELLIANFSMESEGRIAASVSEVVFETVSLSWPFLLDLPDHGAAYFTEKDRLATTSP